MLVRFTIVLVCLMNGAVALADTTGSVSSRPNIILIMADDLGQETLGCYGNDTNRTPHLNRLAAGGMRFTQAYSTPLCTPSRVQLMTGKYNNRNYIVFGLLDKSEKTFATYLKQAGYATAVTGKWQLLGNKKQRKRAEGKIGSRPEEVGFDQYCLWQVEQIGSRYKNPTITFTTGTKTLKGRYGPDVFKDFALSFIRKNRDNPFFLYYPMVLTHAPFQPTPDSPDYDMYPVKGSSDPAYFEGQVEYMDKIVGRLVSELKTQGILQNTILLFIGDNGTGKQVTSIVNGRKIRGAKGSTTKYGTNVPLIAYWPGKIKPGQVNDNLVDFTDFLPTLLNAAGSDAPTDAGLDGISFYDQLIGQPATPRQSVFCYYSPQLKKDFETFWAHDKIWKLYGDGRFFNTVEDPLEQHPIAKNDLSEEGRRARMKLRKAIDEKMAGPVRE